MQQGWPSIAILDLSKAISGKRRKIRGNRKLHMSFRLVQKSVTLNDVKRRNDRFCVISSTSVAFSAHCEKVVEDIPKLSATEI